MRYGIFFKVAKTMLSNEPMITDMLRRKTNEARIKHIAKSIRLMNGVVRMSDQNGDDFRMNRVSIIAEYDMFKIPRIVKNLLLKDISDVKRKRLLRFINHKYKPKTYDHA